MLSKKYLDKFFNIDYFKFILKRNLGLCLIPLAVFFCLLLLCGILGFDLDALVMFLLPYAVAIVPLTALILFKPLTKKGDASYLTSIPLNRTQIFITTYTVGLLMIETSLTIMTFISFLGYTSELAEGLLVFQSLGIIYYTFACLGCMMGGHTITQFLTMGVICFGPVALYLLTKLNLVNLTFGNYTTPINDHLIMLICPLLSAFEFLSDNRWPYWWAHILLVLGILGMCVYLMKRRPIEETGQGTLFKNVDKWIVRPVIYLNIVYVIFNICVFVAFSEAHPYDFSFYMRVILLLIGTSLLVSFLISIWTTKNLKSLFHFKELNYQVVMILLSCGVLLIPLWQNEKARIKNINGFTTVSLRLPLSYVNYHAILPEKDVLQYLETIDQHRDEFMSNSNFYYDDAQSTLYIGENYEQSYYFNVDKINDEVVDVIEAVLLDGRNENNAGNYYYHAFNYDLSSEKAMYIDGAIYNTESILKAVKSTYQEQLSTEFLSQLILERDYYDTLYERQLDVWSDMVMDYYPITFSTMNYFDWLAYVKEHSTMVLDQAEWQKVVASVDVTKGTITSEHLGDILDHVKVLYLDESDYWTIEEASENHVVAQAVLNVEVLSDYEDNTITLFEGTEMGLSLHFTLDKVEGQWYPTFTEVYY